MFLTREYAKHNEQVIGDGGKFHSLTRSLTHLLTPSLHQSAVNFLSRNVLSLFCYECVAWEEQRESSDNNNLFVVNEYEQQYD